MLATDYDLVIILSEMPVPIRLGMTYIDGRFADLLFCTTEQLERQYIDEAPWPVLRGR